MKPSIPVFPVKFSIYSNHVVSTFVQYSHLLLFIMLSLCLDQAHAREWFVTPQASSRLIFDSNYRLRSNLPTRDNLRTIKPKDTIGGVLSAGGIIGSQTENSDIHIRGNVAFNRFNIDNFNSTDFFLYPETWLTVSPRNKLGISGKLFLDRTLARERPDFIDSTPQDLDETDDLLGVPKRRFLKSVRPEWSHSLTEKTTLNLNYEFTDVTYEDAESTGRTDYSIHSGQLNVSHQLMPKTLVFSNASVTLFSTPDIDSSTTYYSLQAGIQHNFSERWEVEIVGGGRYSRSEFRNRNNNKDTSSGLGGLANASITHQYTTGSLHARIAQDIRPTGNGDLQTTNQVAFSWNHHLTEHLSLNLPLSALRASAINEDTNRLDRSYYQVAPAINWKLTPEFSLGLRYRYRYQKYDNADDSADSHSAMLSANYHWQRLSISR